MQDCLEQVLTAQMRPILNTYEGLGLTLQRNFWLCKQFQVWKPGADSWEPGLT
jgi:hypothetical protein